MVIWEDVVEATAVDDVGDSVEGSRVPVGDAVAGGDARSVIAPSWGGDESRQGCVWEDADVVCFCAGSRTPCDGVCWKFDDSRPRSKHKHSRLDERCSMGDADADDPRLSTAGVQSSAGGRAKSGTGGRDEQDVDFFANGERLASIWTAEASEAI